MNKPYLLSDNGIELSNYRLNKAGYLITFILMYVTIAIPIIALCTILIYGSRLSIGYFIAATIFSFIAYFFYRLATWNKHGRELYQLKQGEFRYQPQAKKISFQVHSFDPESLCITLIQLEDQTSYNDEKMKLTKFRLQDASKTVETNIKTPNTVMMELLVIFQSWGIKTEGNFEELHEYDEDQN